MAVDINGYESISVGDTAVGITSALIVPANGHKNGAAWFTIEGGPIRFRIDGTDPTASEGHLVDPGETVDIDGYDNLLRFRIIRTSASATVIRVSIGR